MLAGECCARNHCREVRIARPQPSSSRGCGSFCLAVSACADFVVNRMHRDGRDESSGETGCREGETGSMSVMASGRGGMAGCPNRVAREGAKVFGAGLRFYNSGDAWAMQAHVVTLETAYRRQPAFCRGMRGIDGSVRGKCGANLFATGVFVTRPADLFISRHRPALRLLLHGARRPRPGADSASHLRG